MSWLWHNQLIRGGQTIRQAFCIFVNPSAALFWRQKTQTTQQNNILNHIVSESVFYPRTVVNNMCTPFFLGFVARRAPSANIFYARKAL